LPCDGEKCALILTAPSVGKRAGFNAPDGDHPALGQPLIVAASRELAVDPNVDFDKMSWVEMFGNSDNGPTI